MDGSEPPVERCRWWPAIAVFVLGAAVYSGTALLADLPATPAPAYFDELADAFLHGRLHLENPGVELDLTSHQGRWYVPFPPLPALLLVPWVAGAGVDGVSTVALGVLLGAASCALVFALLDALRRHGYLALARSDPVWLTVLFALGSVNWYLAPAGTVWFLGQVSAVPALAAAALLAATGRPPWAAGAALGAAMLARPHLLLAWPLLAGLARQRIVSGDDPATYRAWRRWCLVSLAPVAAAAALLGAYNEARFGDPLEFGYRRQHVNARVARDLAFHGQFNPRYLPRNLRVMLVAPPQRGPRGVPVPSDEGTGLLWTMPALVLLAGALRPARRSALLAGAWVALLATALLLALYYTTGWRQFGYRFSLDFLVPALVLLGGALTPRTRPALWALTLLGVLVNAWGTVWWYTLP